MSGLTQPHAHLLEALAVGIRPEWGFSPHYGLLQRTLIELRHVDPDLLAGPLIRCYADPVITNPAQLKDNGPWWVGRPPRDVGARPSLAAMLPPRAQSSPEARERAKQAAAQARRPTEPAQ